MSLNGKCGEVEEYPLAGSGGDGPGTIAVVGVITRIPGGGDAAVLSLHFSSTY